MKEEELKKMMCKRYPDYPDISSKEFFELIEICFQEGRQSQKEEERRKYSVALSKALKFRDKEVWAIIEDWWAHTMKISMTSTDLEELKSQLAGEKKEERFKPLNRREEEDIHNPKTIKPIRKRKQIFRK
jgi:hypothetical protein